MQLLRCEQYYMDYSQQSKYFDYVNMHSILASKTQQRWRINYSAEVILNTPNLCTSVKIHMHIIILLHTGNANLWLTFMPIHTKWNDTINLWHCRTSLQTSRLCFNPTALIHSVAMQSDNESQSYFPDNSKICNVMQPKVLQSNLCCSQLFLVAQWQLAAALVLASSYSFLDVILSTNN